MGQGGWVSSRPRRSVIFQLRCNSISSFWVSITFTLQNAHHFFLARHSPLLYYFILKKWHVVISPGDEDWDWHMFLSVSVCCILCRGVKAAAKLCGHWCAQSNSARWDPFRTPQSLSDSLQRTLWGERLWWKAGHPHGLIILCVITLICSVHWHRS